MKIDNNTVASFHYDLADAAGNRIAETARDAAGNVRRTVQRRFDALNRVEQQTGRELQ